MGIVQPGPQPGLLPAPQQPHNIGRSQHGPGLLEDFEVVT